MNKKWKNDIPHSCSITLQNIVNDPLKVALSEDFIELFPFKCMIATDFIEIKMILFKKKLKAKINALV